MSVVYRLCQLWFGLWQERAVNSALAEALAEVPSHKFVPLAYQIASRLGAGTGAAAAFQVRGRARWRALVGRRWRWRALVGG